jgi:hypothetical protein
MANKGLLTPEMMGAALQDCYRAAAALNPLLKRAMEESKASASRLATLGAERTGMQLPIDAQLIEATQKVSASAYAIFMQPNAVLTPELLEMYAEVQYQLGRPESLPYIFDYYANKPTAEAGKDGGIVFKPANPKAPSRAVNIVTAELGLRTAIEAKNLDAALGIIEASYCAPAYRRQKMLKELTVPAMALASLPFGIFGVATAYAANWQNTMDMTTATGIAFAGISGYFFVVTSMGLIAKLSHKDQMKRVTWTPGTPLRYRWLREEERAALDKVACAWGFKEEWRHGEEAGPEWEGLKEYMGYRQMLLDRVEFMQGMS